MRGGDFSKVGEAIQGVTQESAEKHYQIMLRAEQREKQKIWTAEEEQKLEQLVLQHQNSRDLWHIIS